MALVKSDFDLIKRKLTISKSYQRINGADMITSPKTEKSNRVIDMLKFLCDEMEGYFGMFYSLADDTRLFHISKSYLHHEMDRGCKKAGVKRVRIHDDRVIIGASQKKPSKIKGLQMILSYYFLQ